MNLFLDESMVLPPGDFDKNTLLPIMHMARKRLSDKRKAGLQAQKELKQGTGGYLSLLLLNTVHTLQVSV